MKIDLLHNKIVKDNMTESFSIAFSEWIERAVGELRNGMPEVVQMYEDYLDCGFISESYFYYPLSLVYPFGVERAWVRWSVADKRRFAGGVPFAYVGKDSIEFELCDSVPFEFSDVLSGRADYFEGGYAPLTIESPTDDKKLLVGKYSQSFVDEMVRQISCKIESAFSVTGIEDSGIELYLVFAPDTYMEHVVGNVTYRRLLISARACSARDLWIKWTRLDGAGSYTVSDDVTGEEIIFELGEDVPQKIREKEYRFLVRTSSAKYQAAMGRKNITEWRDMVKRVIRRGELIKVEAEDVSELPTDEAPTESPVISEPERVDADTNADLTHKLQEVLLGRSTSPQPTVRAAGTDDNSDLAALLRSVLPGRDEPIDLAEDVPVAFDEAARADEITETADDGVPPFDIDNEPEQTVRDTVTAEPEDKAAQDIEAELRRRIEAEIRERLEAEARELIREHERLKAENERLSELARIAEEEKLASEAARIVEAERLREELEAKERAEAREKERMADAARLALIEQQRLEAARAEDERKREAEEARLREERERALEEERIAAERDRLDAERRAAERAEQERAYREAQKAAEAEAERKSAESKTYISKNLRLIFVRKIDPNIIKNIYDIINTTIKYFKKEHLYIKIKASILDSTTVNLNFVKFPEQEQELLVSIIKVLGNSKLGITKAILE